MERNKRVLERFLDTRSPAPAHSGPSGSPPSTFSRGKIDEFELANVGLVSLSQDGDVQWHHNPEQSTPYSEALYERLRTRITQDLEQ